MRVCARVCCEVQEHSYVAAPTAGMLLNVIVSDSIDDLVERGDVWMFAVS